MEAVKGVIFDRGEDKIEGHKVYKYLVTLMVVTQEPIESLPAETIVMSTSISPLISKFLNSSKKYKVPYKLGTCDNAIIAVANMHPEELEPLDKDKQIEEIKNQL